MVKKDFKRKIVCMLLKFKIYEQLTLICIEHPSKEDQVRCVHLGDKAPPNARGPVDLLGSLRFDKHVDCSFRRRSF